MTINLGTPKPTELKPQITVIGVGGAGGNAVNNMINSSLEGVEFLACNTDAQALSLTVAPRQVQLGINLTNGLGSGSKPEVGRAAAQEAIDEILDHIGGSHMAFVTAGMGGGTGTGAAPVIAQLARDAGVLTVGVVTKPFSFEGAHRMAIAEAGIQELQNFVDTLIVIPNQNLFRVANEKTTFADAFKMADDVLHAGVRGVTDLMVMPGLINLDFADVKAVMEEMGKAMMGTGDAEGEKRALQAAEAAISNPLLEDTSMAGARGMLVNITGGADMTLFEVDEAVNRIKEEVDQNANIIFGSTFDERLEGTMRVSIVATGIDVAEDSVRPPRKLQVVSAAGAGAGAGAAAGAPESGIATPVEMPVDPQIGIPSRGFEIDRPQPLTADGPSPSAESPPAPPAPETAAPAMAGRPAASEPQPGLRTMASAQLETNPFIAPPPVETKAAPQPRMAPDPFAEAAVTNGGLAPRRAGPSLLERMTGLGRKAKDDRQPAPAESAPEARTPGPEPLRVQTPAAEAPAQAQAEAQAPRAAPEAHRSPEAGPAPEPSPAPRMPPAPEPQPPELASSPVTAPPAKPAPTLNVNAEDRMVRGASEDELLEIPAFLRRQAN